MSKKVKILISALVVALLATIAPATLVMAQENEDEPAPQTRLEMKERLLARVAEILGISVDELESAFAQARDEMHEECYQQRGCCRRWIKEKIRERFVERRHRILRNQTAMLDKAVEKGFISEKEAQEIREWWQSRPEVLKNFPLRSGMHPAIGGNQRNACPYSMHGDGAMYRSGRHSGLQTGLSPRDALYPLNP